MPLVRTSLYKCTSKHALVEFSWTIALPCKRRVIQHTPLISGLAPPRAWAQRVDDHAHRLTLNIVILGTDDGGALMSCRPTPPSGLLVAPSRLTGGEWYIPIWRAPCVANFYEAIQAAQPLQREWVRTHPIDVTKLFSESAKVEWKLHWQHTMHRDRLGGALQHLDWIGRPGAGAHPHVECRGSAKMGLKHNPCGDATPTQQQAYVGAQHKETKHLVQCAEHTSQLKFRIASIGLPRSLCREQRTWS